MFSISLNKNKILLYTLLFLFSVSTLAQAHHLNGKIEVEGGKTLKNLIIYLEPADSSKLKLEPKLHKILQKGRQFNPDLLVVSPGDKVQFLNDEDREIDHNIYSLSRLKNFDLGLGERGSVLDITIDKNGAGNFYCSVHKLMEGRMISLNTRYFTILERPGKFILPNIPAGDWIVKVFVFHRRYKVVPVTITLNAASHEEIELKVVKK